MERYFQWITTHKWMTDYTPQTEWIQRRGIMVWLAEVCTSLGSGLYLISLFLFSFVSNDMSYLWGMIAGWLIIMFLKIPLHLAYFGKPFRFWRTIPPFSSGWKTSWFARGILFSIFFGTFGFLQIVSSFLLINPQIVTWEFLLPIDILLRVLAGLTAFLTGIYPGFIMSFVKGIQFWNSALLPVVLILSGILDGCALLMAIGLAGANVDNVLLDLISSVLLIVNIFFIVVYLWGATYAGAGAKRSVLELIKGSVAPVFWIALIVLGMVVPLIISLFSLSFHGAVSEELLRLLLIIGVISHTVGAFTLKYCILKVGIYKPLFTVTV
jgi:formate-dependent nitrite reductase membrane component NrfD